MALSCSVHGCDALWTHAELAAALQSDAHFADYVAKLTATAECERANVLSVRHCAELEQQRRLLSGELTRDETLGLHKRHIEEKLLNLHCPRCTTVFDANDGCFALTCGSCRTGFCAWCLLDCGPDAHKHVGTCALLKQYSKDAGVEATWTLCHRARRTALVSEYVRSRVRAELRPDVLREVAGTLRRVGVEIAIQAVAARMLPSPKV